MTLVLDGATMAKALTALSKAANTGAPWMPNTDSDNGRLQDRFLAWYYQNWKAVEALENLKSEASSDAAVLNRFLTDNGFRPMFRDISPGGVGAAAILDMLVTWAAEASLTTLTTYTNGYQHPKQHQAFELPVAGGVEIFDVPGSNQLVKLNTNEGGAVWLTIGDQPPHGLDLIETAVMTMATRDPADTTWISSVIVPTIEIDTTVELDWMLGVFTGSHVIDQAFQAFKLRMNEEGAHVKAVSGFGTMRGGPRKPTPLRLDQPFAGWFTQPGSEIPIAAFYADMDCWKVSEGNLADL